MRHIQLNAVFPLWIHLGLKVRISIQKMSILLFRLLRNLQNGLRQFAAAFKFEHKEGNFICLKILDNVNFLVRIALSGGRNALEFLRIFSNKEYYSDSSVVEYLRNSFRYDDVLENIILEMSKEDSSYNVFDEEQKAILCGSPQGVLFFEDDSEVRYSNPALLAARISNILDGEEDDLYAFGDFSDVINLLYLDYAK